MSFNCLAKFRTFLRSQHRSGNTNRHYGSLGGTNGAAGVCGSCSKLETCNFAPVDFVFTSIHNKMRINVQKVVESFFRLSDPASDFKCKDVLKKNKKKTIKNNSKMSGRHLINFIILNISDNSYVFLYFHIYNRIDSN